MAKLHRALLILVLLASLPAFGQSADQAILSAVDSPDPIVPGNDLTYTVQVKNNGPNSATNGGLSMSWPQTLAYVSASGPAGFTCSPFGQSLSCINPTFPSGTTATFTIVMKVDASLLNFADTTVTSFFSTSGTTADPVSGNNTVNVTTSIDSPQVDLALTVTDSPDPVAPNGNITYTVPVSNDGPDTATAVNFNVYNNGSLRFQSVTAPAGWSCTAPAVGSQPAFTCTKASMAGGSGGTFTVVVKADPAILGISDSTVATNFSINGTGNDTNVANNSVTEGTSYVTPKADTALTVVDSPDPVTPDNNITYTVQVTNNGPDTATGAQMNVYNGGTLQFQSVSVPAGWTCNAPAVNAAPQFTCSNPSFGSGAHSTFTVVLKASLAVVGNADTTLQTNFNINSSVYDTNNGNNSVTESTSYHVAHSNIGVTASDAPDPLPAGNNITYTGAVTNAGPDPATGMSFTVVLNAKLLFQSITGPAGFACSTPAVGSNGTITCTASSITNGANLSYTIVAKVDPALLTGPGGTISQTFTVSAGPNDPTPSDNSVTVSTQYTTPTPPTVTSITPQVGPVAGGTAVSIVGLDFRAGAVVQLGGKNATNVIVVNSTNITAVSASHAAGLVDVAVANTDTGFGTKPSAYRYCAIGDVNCDGQRNAADIFYMINKLFAGGPACIGSGDVNNDGSFAASDIFYFINHLFAGGPAIVEPPLP